MSGKRCRAQKHSTSYFGDLTRNTNAAFLQGQRCARNRERLLRLWTVPFGVSSVPHSCLHVGRHSPAPRARGRAVTSGLSPTCTGHPSQKEEGNPGVMLVMETPGAAQPRTPRAQGCGSTSACACPWPLERGDSRSPQLQHKQINTQQDLKRESLSVMSLATVSQPALIVPNLWLTLLHFPAMPVGCRVAAGAAAGSCGTVPPHFSRASRTPCPGTGGRVRWPQRGTSAGGFRQCQAIPPSRACCAFSAISLQPHLGTFLHASAHNSKPFLVCKKCVRHPQSCWPGLFPCPTWDQRSQLMHSFASTTAPAPGALLAVPRRRR